MNDQALLARLDRLAAALERLAAGNDEIVRDALEWSITRGARSGRVAWQFIQDLAGRLGQRLPAS